MATTKSDWAAFKRQMARNELFMLERIEYHARKLIEEGKNPQTSFEWIERERRRIQDSLGDVGR